MLRSLAVAFGFLTLTPISADAVEPVELGRAVTWFPAVGAALGALAAVTGGLLGGLVDSGLLAVALVAVHAGVTGGLHIDGFADVFDALGGGRGRRDRMLAILRDSRIGAHGAAAVVLLLVAKIAAVAHVVGHGALWPLYAAPVAARWTVVPIIVGFPYARPDGLGRAFHVHAGAAQLVGATLVAALALGWFGAAAFAPALAALLTGLGLAIWLHRRLGGLTGDVYGAVIEAAELAFLVIAGR